jgi:elongation factor Ts
MRQPYILNEDITVQQLINEKVVALGESIVVRRFARWALGETTAEDEE